MSTKRTSPISSAMTDGMKSSSWIRQMFEEGNRLKARYGADAVFDFSLGNPSVPPPPRFHELLVEVAGASSPSDHRYMTNAGLLETRRWVAQEAEADHGGPFAPEQVVMTCGAAGGLNILLRAILDAGDEVVLLAPYFPEYRFYVENNGGRVRIVDTDPDFQPDVDAILAAVGERTRAIIVNSPNNPTGVVYEPARIAALGAALDRRFDETGSPVFLVSDEPYRRLRYDGAPHASVIEASRHGLVCSSFSKDLGLAGERIGYLLVNPRTPEHAQLENALAIATRTLGFVNAPALMQRVLPLCGGLSVDVAAYERNRDALVAGLREAGYDLPEARGAFFLFPRVPGGDDVGFCAALRERRVLCVPGRGFGTPGHIRISYAVAPKVIAGAIPLFAEVLAESIAAHRAGRGEPPAS